MDLVGIAYQKFGGPGRDRTDDLFHAMEARSQLRHRPTLAKKAGTTTSILAERLLLVKPERGPAVSWTQSAVLIYPRS